MGAFLEYDAFLHAVGALNNSQRYGLMFLYSFDIVYLFQVLFYSPQILLGIQYAPFLTSVRPLAS